MSEIWILEEIFKKKKTETVKSHEINGTIVFLVWLSGLKGLKFKDLLDLRSF